MKTAQCLILAAFSCITLGGCGNGRERTLRVEDAITGRPISPICVVVEDTSETKIMFWTGMSSSGVSMHTRVLTFQTSETKLPPAAINGIPLFIGIGFTQRVSSTNYQIVAGGYEIGDPRNTNDGGVLKLRPLTATDVSFDREDISNTVIMRDDLPGMSGDKTQLVRMLRSNFGIILDRFRAEMPAETAGVGIGHLLRQIDWLDRHPNGEFGQDERP